MKKRFMSLIFAVMIFLMQMCTTVISFAASTEANKFNVIFVLDASGSMNQTDQSGLRYDALNLFLGLLTENGNHVGDVIFTQTIDNTLNIKEITSQDDKRQVLENLKSINPSSGDTNIGLALAAATDMLDSGKNANLDSVILLLSDGNTDLDTKKALEESQYYKEYGIAHAKSSKYKIYCIGLNANGAMNGDELKSIAEQTGGQFVEVASPEDLSKVTETFYSMIYNTPSETERVIIGQDGTVKKNFSVPDIGIEEVNIVVRGQNDKIELVQPDGSMVPQTEVDQMSLKTPEYTIAKIPNPTKGEWSVVVYGNPGAEVTVTLISNVDLAVRAEAQPMNQVYKKGDKVKVLATIVSKGSDISDENIYNANKAELTLTNNASGQEEKIPMTVNNGKYVAEITLSDLAAYDAVVEVTANNIKKSSDKLTFNVDNNPPQVLQDVVRDKIVLWPFKKNTKTYDMSQYVTDDADTVLKYNLEASSFKDGDVTIDNGILTVSPSIGVDGTVTVTATDSKGASVPVEFAFSVVSVAKITIIIVAIIVLLILGVLAVFAIKIARMRYYGKIMLQIYDKQNNISYNKQIHEPYRGKQPIRRLDAAAMEVGLDGVFKPKNSGYIIYESKRPFYCSLSPDRSAPVKKIDIALGMTVTISSSEDFLSGANITYI